MDDQNRFFKVLTAKKAEDNLSSEAVKEFEN
jgi:hypothetical protein